MALPTIPAGDNRFSFTVLVPYLATARTDAYVDKITWRNLFQHACSGVAATAAQEAQYYKLVALLENSLDRWTRKNDYRLCLELLNALGLIAVAAYYTALIVRLDEYPTNEYILSRELAKDINHLFGVTYY